MGVVRFGLIACLGLVSLSLTVSLIAQQTAPVAIAPVPAVLLDAKRVFISNAGADSGLSLIRSAAILTVPTTSFMRVL
jgi:hypothetical protein